MSRHLYDALKTSLVDEFSRFEGSAGALQGFKTNYARIVGSKRKLESILSLEDLLRTLEKRDRLSPDNLKIVSEINGQLRSQKVAELLTQLTPEAKKPSIIHDVNNTIANEIGNSYRQFGRCIGISNADIEIIDIQYPTDVRTRIWTMLEIIRNQIPNEQDYCNELCRALKECGRNDIKKKVYNLTKS